MFGFKQIFSKLGKLASKIARKVLVYSVAIPTLVLIVFIAGFTVFWLKYVNNITNYTWEFYE